MAKHAVATPVEAAQRSRTLNQMPNPGDFLWGFQGFMFGLKLIIMAFLVVMMTVAESWYSPLFAILGAYYVSSYTPNFDSYRSFGLTTELWKRHALLGMVIVAALGVTFAVVLRFFVGGSWWITALYAIGACIALAVHWYSDPDEKWIPFKEAKQSSNQTTLADVAKTESAPPVRTLVTVPLLRAWLKMWAAVGVAAIVVVAVGFIFSQEEPMGLVVPGIWAACMISGSFVWVAIKSTFAHHLALGGTRKDWVNHYFLTSLINPVLMAALMIPAWRLTEFITPGIVALMMCFALWLPAFFCLIEFMEAGRNWWIALPFIAAAIGTGIAAASDAITSVNAVALSALAYVWLYFYLQAIRDRLNPYAGGISQYLGISQQ